MLKSKLFLKIFAGVMLVSLSYFAAVYFITIPLVKKTVYKQEERTAKTILSNVYELINVYYFGIKAYEDYALASHKRDVKNAVFIALSHIRNYYNDVRRGKLTRKQAERKVLKDIRSWRFGNNNYVFVIDKEGRLIAHPWVPYGKNVIDLKDIKGKYLIREIIKAAKSNPEGGFTKYWWRRIGSDKPVEKLSFSKLFPEWEWVVGSGVYIDDVKEEIEKRKRKAIEEIRKVLTSIKIGKSGYLFIFDSEGKMIVHPDRKLIGKDATHFVNKLTGESIIEELKRAADTGKPVAYIWYKPNQSNEFSFKKLSWVRYFDGFDWYIASSVYEDDLLFAAQSLSNRIRLATAVILVLVVILAYLFFNRMISPIKQLSKLALKVKNGDLTARSNIKRNDEIGVLSDVFNSMVEELVDHIENLDRKVLERTKELEQKNRELEEAISRLKETQRQLVESEKMAALGGLVAGVAHEINTPLGIGVTAASHLEILAKEFVKKYEEGKLKRSDFEKFLDNLKQSTSIILSNLNRAAELVRSFKQIAVDQSAGDKRRFNVKKYVEEILMSLKPKWKKTKHKVELECPDDLEIVSYPGAFSQIITNLIVNSLNHAFEKNQEGLIRLKFYKDGDDLVFEYSDNGKGIPKDILPKIFEPFFTTKRSKGGSGLGLHILYNLVTQKLKGTVECESEKGKGTKFIIRVPLEV